MNTQEKAPGKEPSGEQEIFETYHSIYEALIEFAGLLGDEENRARIYNTSPPRFVQRMIDLIFVEIVQPFLKLDELLGLHYDEKLNEKYGHK